MLGHAIAAKAPPTVEGASGLQRWVVEVADRALAVEGFRVRRIQLGILCQALRQVRIGDKRNAEGHRIGFAFSQPGIGLILGEALVGDKYAAEGLFQAWRQAVVGFLLAGADKGDAAFAQFTSDVGEGLGAVGVAHVMAVGTRCQVHAHTASAPDFDCRIGDFQQQARTVFQAAAVAISALVGAALQELVEQVTVRAVDFHAVKAGGLGVFRAHAIGLDDIGDFFGFQGARGDEVLHRAYQADVTRRLDGARRDRQLTVQVDRVGNAPDVPQLQNDFAACSVHGLGHIAPATYLLIRPDTGGIRVADAHWGHGGGFTDDQAGAGALHVVLGHQRVGHAAFIGAAAGQRGHDDAVIELQIANLDRVEKCGHGTVLSGYSLSASCGSGLRVLKVSRVASNASTARAAAARGTRVD